MNRTVANALTLGGLVWGFAFAALSTLNLPERVPVHFGIDGNPDRWGSRGEGIFNLLMMPLMLLFALAIMWAIERFDARARAQSRFLDVVRVGITFVLLIAQWSIVHSTTQGASDLRLILVAIGVLFVVLGNAMPKVTPNPYAGVRLPYTYASDRAWRVTNRNGGYLFVGLGAFVALAGVVLPERAAVYALLVMPVGLMAGLVWLTLLAKREYERDPERRPLA
jgi:uncharacterized membrane protein